MEYNSKVPDAAWLGLVLFLIISILDVSMYYIQSSKM